MVRASWRLLARKDFDAWAYDISWPQDRAVLPLLSVVNLAVEDIKFAYNAWSLLRLSMFYGVGYPKVVSNLTGTRPSMDIAYGANRLFYLNSRVGEPLSAAAVKVALTPDHPRAVPIQQFSWQDALRPAEDGSATVGVEIVLGMENGLSDAVAQQCDHYVYISQYGSIGSLSMMSAMAIATHLAACSASPETTTAVGPASAPANGHMPLSNHSTTDSNSRPHEADLLTCTNDEIVDLLQQRRAHYPLQIGVMMYNELGDRNIGAIMRNANAFNCEKMIIVNRRRFSRRGAVGTNHILETAFVGSLASPQGLRHLDGYEVWLMYQYYPYLLTHHTDEADHEANSDSASAFIRHEDPRLMGYLSTRHVLSNRHPLSERYRHLNDGSALFLDDAEGLVNALRGVKARGLKGVMLAVPEEGVVHHPQVATVAQRVLYVVRPQNLANTVQRGLNGAMASAVALERIRTCIDCI